MVVFLFDIGRLNCYRCHSHCFTRLLICVLLINRCGFIQTTAMTTLQTDSYANSLSQMSSIISPSRLSSLMELPTPLPPPSLSSTSSSPSPPTTLLPSPPPTPKQQHKQKPTLDGNNKPLFQFFISPFFLHDCIDRPSQHKK